LPFPVPPSHLINGPQISVLLDSQDFVRSLTVLGRAACDSFVALPNNT